MKTLKAFIVEDEIHNREFLQELLAEYCASDVEVAGSAGTVIETLEQLKKIKVNLLFLDIELADGTVFELLQQLDYKAYKIIFITGYAEHAIRAIKFGALDYLLKPVSVADLVDAVQKVLHKSLAENADLDDFIRRKSFSVSDYLLVHSQAAIDKIPMQHISHLEADGIYTVIHHEGKKTVSSRHIGLYEDVLPADVFHRCHKSYIVNKYHIKKIIKGRGLCLILFDNSELPVAVRKKDEFMLWYKG